MGCVNETNAKLMKLNWKGKVLKKSPINEVGIEMEVADNT